MSFSVENWLAHFDMERQKWKRKLYFSSFEKGTKFKNLFFSFPGSKYKNLERFVVI